MSTCFTTKEKPQVSNREKQYLKRPRYASKISGCAGRSERSRLSGEKRSC